MKEERMRKKKVNNYNSQLKKKENKVYKQKEGNLLKEKEI